MKARQRQVVVVTGASAGIGRAVAREFARRHVRVALLARGRQGLEGAKRDVEALGGEALVLPTDVADPQQVENAADAAEDAFGPIDIWINNAMASVLAPLHQVTVAEFHRVTEVTYLGQVHGAMAALRRMRPRDRGSIVFVGSALAYRGIPLQAAYCGAKHAVQGFFDSLRAELLHDRSNVRVTMVQLPGVNTPQFEWMRNRMPNKPRPVGTVYQPEVAARAIVWAATHDRRELTVGMPAVHAILANKLAPGLMDRHLANTVYEGHQTDEPDDPQRPNNLFEPLPHDFGAHGPFDDQSQRSSMQLWINTHLKLVAAVAVLGVAAVARLLRHRQPSQCDRLIKKSGARSARD